MQKRYGVLPEEVTASDFVESLKAEKSSESFRNEVAAVSGRSLMQMIIVDKKRPIYMIEHFIYVTLSLISPYVYAWFAVFGTPEPQSFMYTLMFVFESFFLFNIIFTFFVELNVDGQIQPVREITTIAKEYLKNDFLLDLLPVLPLQFLNLNGEEYKFYLIKIIRIFNGI